MPVRIVHLLKMIKVDEHDREFVIVALRAVNLRLQDEAHVTGVIERSAIVGDGQLVNFLDVSRVFQRNRGEVRKRFEELQVARIESIRPHAIDQLDDSQARIAKSYRYRYNRLRLVLG